MNVPIKNITKVDTSKGVPVWTTSMCDIRGYAEYYVAKEGGPLDETARREAIIKHKEEMNQIVELIKTNFTNQAEIGSNTILLSISCINFLSLSVTHKCCASFVKHVFDHKFGGIAYTGAQTQKVVTVTRETLVPSMLPFVLRDNDRIVSGYGVYACSMIVPDINSFSITPTAAGFLFEKEKDGIMEQWEKLTSDKEKKDYLVSLLIPTKGDTLYHNYNPADLIFQESKEKRRLYYLCALSHYKSNEFRNLNNENGISVSSTPILTIETQNNTLVTFKDTATVLPFSVRRTNSEGLVTTVYTTDMRKRKHVGIEGYGGISCEPVNKKTKTTEIILEPSKTSTEVILETPIISKEGILEAQRKEIEITFQNIIDAAGKYIAPKTLNENETKRWADITIAFDENKSLMNSKKNIQKFKENLRLTDIRTLLLLLNDIKHDLDPTIMNNVEKWIDFTQENPSTGTVDTNDIIKRLKETEKIIRDLVPSTSLTSTAKAPGKKRV